MDQAPGGYTYQCDRVCGGVCLHGVFLCDQPGQHGPDPCGCPGGQRCGLLGAGLILRDGTNIRGLSTAATIWTTAAIGILCTLPKVLYAVIVAAVVVVMHLVLHPLSNKINKLRSYDKEKRAKDECMYKISVTCLDNFEVDIRAHLMSALKDARDIILHNLESSETDDGNTKIRAYVSAAKKNDEAIENVLNRIGKDEGILRAGWNIINE